MRSPFLWAATGLRGHVGIHTRSCLRARWTPPRWEITKEDQPPPSSTKTRQASQHPGETGRARRCHPPHGPPAPHGLAPGPEAHGGRRGSVGQRPGPVSRPRWPPGSPLPLTTCRHDGSWRVLRCPGGCGAWPRPRPGSSGGSGGIRVGGRLRAGPHPRPRPPDRQGRQEGGGWGVQYQGGRRKRPLGAGGSCTVLGAIRLGLWGEAVVTPRPVPPSRSLGWARLQPPLPLSWGLTLTPSAFLLSRLLAAALGGSRHAERGAVHCSPHPHTRRPRGPGSPRAREGVAARQGRLPHPA